MDIVDVFNVCEKDDSGQYTCEYFGENREAAINYLKVRDGILSKQLKGWEKETGINHSIWRKDGHAIDLYFDMQEVDLDNNVFEE